MLLHLEWDYPGVRVPTGDVHPNPTAKGLHLVRCNVRLLRMDFARGSNWM